MGVRRFGIRLAVLLVVALVASACNDGGSIGVAGEDFPTTTDTVPQTTVPPTTTTARATTTTERPASETEQLPEGVSSDFTNVMDRTTFEGALTGGRRLTVTFYGGPRGDQDSACSWDHRLEVEETASEVRVVLVAIKILAPFEQEEECYESFEEWAVTTTLAEPLGDRALIATAGDRQVETVQIETRLLPTELPFEPGFDETFSLASDDRLLPQRVATYTAESGTGRITVRTSPITTGPRLTEIRKRSTSEPITIRRENDGVILIDEVRDVTLGFEEQGWYYRIDSFAVEDPSVVIDFARSFERPALADADGRAVQLLEPPNPPPLQAGQEEGESGWLLLLPGDQVVR